MRHFVLCILLLLFAIPSVAQPLSPIDGVLFPFPGGSPHPPSATSAGLALSDRWLGDEPYVNPAAPSTGVVVASPALLHSSRQDLRAGNRNFDETPAVVDGGGAALGLGPRVPLWIYFHQPVLRKDDFVFNRGTVNDPTVTPAIIQGEAESREIRAGLSGSMRLAGVRWGAAVEWTRREDRFRVIEQSGSPDQGEREVTFEGNAVGWALGARFEPSEVGAGSWTLGAGVRALPELEVKGEQRLLLLSGDSTATITGRRDAGWEGGFSLGYAITDDFAVLAGAEARSEQDWGSIGVTSGPFTSWSLGARYHVPADAWSFRFGIGQEQQSDVPETRAGLIGLGVGWDMEGLVVDLGLLHRSLERSGGRPRSYDDRVIGSVRVDF